MDKKYTDEFLISELHRFVKENKRTPTTKEITPKNGYPSYATYRNYFGSWNKSLKTAKLNLNQINKYTDEFLISELHRFVKENKRTPTSLEMILENNYPSVSVYQAHFGSWNNALTIANLKINQATIKIIGTEFCCECGCTNKKSWITKGLPTGQLMCENCYQKSKNDYMNGNLNVNSSTGFAFLTQRVVAKTLNLELKHDCNCSVNFNHPYDLYDNKKYGKIEVKGSKLSLNNAWNFNLSNKYTPNNYIFIGFNENKKNILRVWISNKSSNLVFEKKSVSITNNIKSGLKRAKPWEVNAKPYNDAFHSMSIDNCSVLTNNK